MFAAQCWAHFVVVKSWILEDEKMEWNEIESNLKYMSLLIDAFLDDVSIFHVKVDVKSREIFTLLFFLSDERRWKEQGLNSKADFYISFSSSSSSSMEALFFVVVLYFMHSYWCTYHIILYQSDVVWHKFCTPSLHHKSFSFLWTQIWSVIHRFVSFIQTLIFYPLTFSQRFDFSFFFSPTLFRCSIIFLSLLWRPCQANKNRKKIKIKNIFLFLFC